MTEKFDQLPAKPRPQPAAENAPFWAALREHRFVVQRCKECQQLRHYPRPLCDACYSFEYTWQEIEPHGAVHSWTVSHHPFHPGFKQDLPYVTVTADLDAGVRLQAPLVDGDVESLKLAVRVAVGYIDVDSELTYPVLRLIG